MPHGNEAHSKNSLLGNRLSRDSQKGLWITICVGCVILIAVVVVGTFFIDSQRVRFITEFSLTVVLGTLVAVQTYIYRRQSDIMERQLKATERAADASYIAQRAYMGIRELDIGGPLVVGNFHFLNITWQNGGKTPAWNFRCIADLVLSKDEPKGTIYFADDDYGDISGSFWPSDATRTITYEGGQIHVTDELVKELWEGRERRLWAVVRAVYRDISGDVQWFYNAAIYMVNPLRPHEGRFVETFQYVDYVSEPEKGLGSAEEFNQDTP